MANDYEETRESNGDFGKGNPGKPAGAVSKATRFKNLIYEAIENRKEELTAKDVLELAKIAAKFVPKEHNIKGEMQHSGFLENMIKKAENLKEEQNGNTNKDQDILDS